jgi:hypothetical protein
MRAIVDPITASWPPVDVDIDSGPDDLTCPGVWGQSEGSALPARSDPQPARARGVDVMAEGVPEGTPCERVAGMEED